MIDYNSLARETMDHLVNIGVIKLISKTNEAPTIDSPEIIAFREQLTQPIVENIINHLERNTLEEPLP